MTWWRRISLSFFLIVALSTVVASAVAADYPGGVKAIQLLKATEAANGQKLSYCRTDKPEVTALLVEIPVGGSTGWHSHPIPVYAYVLSGALTVEIKDGGTYEYREGDALVEVINTPHNGITKGDKPAKLAVFYTGEAGKPIVVPVESRQEH